jgi:hypothetical protein
MYARDNDPELLDIGSHVVAINQLVAQLNKVTRETYKPRYQDIDNIATEIRHHSAMIQRICDSVRGL